MAFAQLMIAVVIALATLSGTPAEARKVTPPITPNLRVCTDRAAPPITPAGFKRTRSRLIAKGRVQHWIDDVVQAPGEFDVKVKVTYGRFSKDLEREIVHVYVDDCLEWRALGSALTDGDGRATVRGPALAVGVYDLLLVVDGDGTMVRGRAWMLPRGTHLVITDIDGTLTTDDGELVEHIVATSLGSGDPPTAYADGAALTQAHAARGELVVYLSGRPSFLRPHTIDWLRAGGYAPGPVILAPSMSAAKPSVGGVGKFKTRAIKALQQAGYRIGDVYGNARTDVYAYAHAGMPQPQTFIIGKHGGADATIAVDGKTGWTARAKAVKALAPVIQPFTR